MAAPPETVREEDEDGIEDSRLLFTRAARDLLGGARKGLRSFFRYQRRVQPVVLVGRNVTTDAQTFDSIINSNNRLRTTGGYLGSETVLDAPTSFTMEIGEWAYVASGNIAGNASAFIPLLATAIGQPLFEVHQILQTLSAVGVATRTMTLQVVAGMPAIPLRGAADDDFAVTGPTITDAEEGSVFIPRAPGLVQLNDNGTITTSDISPLPIMGGDSLTITSVITAGLAADTHRIAAVMRRVA